MSILQLARLKDGFARLYGGWGPETGIEQMRSDWDAFLGAHRLDAKVTPGTGFGVDCAWVVAPGVPAAGEGGTILFLHGGGYQIGSTASHHNLMVRLSEEAGCRVLGLDYRRAPEHRFPAPVEDAMAAYRCLLDQGISAQRIALCGDSAGGGLAVALMTCLRQQALPLPAAAALMSPWVDMAATGDSFEANAARDPVTSRELILRMARTYLGRGGDPRHPLASPVHADLSGLPPMLVQVGEDEVLLDDARALVSVARSGGVDARLSVWPRMIHTFQLFAGRLDEADAAIGEAARFLADAIARATDGDRT